LFSGNQFQAQKLNKDIFETIYYHALKASSEIAAREGPYETYEGSPVSKVCWVSSNVNTSSAVA
jgi:ribonucleotide reductase alpha subunit